MEGDNVEVMAAEKTLVDTHDNILVQSIHQVLGLNETAARFLRYTPQDIAVLIDTAEPDHDVEQCCQILKKYTPDVNVHSAKTFPRTGIVVDYLDSFHGLDARVVFYVLSSQRMMKQDNDNRILQRSIHNPRYLTFLASRAIHKAVFLVPILDAEIFREMCFDYFERKLKVCATGFIGIIFFHTFINYTVGCCVT